MPTVIGLNRDCDRLQPSVSTVIFYSYLCPIISLFAPKEASSEVGSQEIRVLVDLITL